MRGDYYYITVCGVTGKTFVMNKDKDKGHYLFALLLW